MLSDSVTTAPWVLPSWPRRPYPPRGGLRARGVEVSALVGLLALPALWALYNVYAVLRVRRSVVPLRDAPGRDAWPRLSLIVPACNEGETIEEATRAKLASDYPNLEV